MKKIEVLPQQYRDDIYTMLSEILHVGVERIDEFSNIRKDFRTLSINNEIDIILAFEQHFNIEITVKDFEKVDTVGQIYKLIKDKLNEKS